MVCVRVFYSFNVKSKVVGVVGPKVNTIQDTIQDGTIDRLLEFYTTEKTEKS